jgi:hypothetical protein
MSPGVQSKDDTPGGGGHGQRDIVCILHQDGKPRMTQTGAPENRFMLLPFEACKIIDTWNVGGLRGTGSHDVAVSDVFVPISYGSGFTDPYVLPEPR